jgi:PAS domain S-box-containing protein
MILLSLRKKFIIGTVVLIVMIGGALALLVRHELHARFQEEIRKRGLSIARYIAEAAEIPLITENSISLKLLVNDYKKIDKDIDYIYIVSPDKNILTHTFPTSFPLDLRIAAERKSSRPGTFEPFQSQNGLLYDVSVPIQNGALGTVHIGLYESVIQSNVQGVLSKMFPFVLAIMAVGIAAALLFASAITRPIALLTEGVQQVSRGGLDKVLKIDTLDEIGQLAAAFNRMTESLRQTTVSREFMEKLIDTMNDVLVVMSPDGVVRSVNRAFLHLFEYPEEMVVGRSVHDFTHQEAPQCIYQAFLQSRQNDRMHGIESECLSVSGKLIPMLFSFAVMKDDDGQPVAIICAAQDISDIKQAQDSLQRKRDELEILNRNLEDMVSSRTAELAVTNEGLRGEVAERKRTALELEKALEAAEAASRAKTVFLANMSHEMRTPLNSIIGGAEYLENARFEPDQMRCLEMVRQAGDSLLALVNDLIDLSRIEAGQLELASEEFVLADAMEGVVNMLRLTAQRKQISLSLDLAPDLPHVVLGDQDRIRQIMLNLLANAIKFTDTGGTVSASISRISRENDTVEVRFVVRDTGIGIDADKVDMIFESFAQADSSITRRFGGSGLGLAISRRLVEAMGGSFQVESVPGVGSSFSFSITYRLAKSGSAPTQDKSAAAVSRLPDSPLYSKGVSRILLVDDSLENRELVRLIFSRLSLELDEAENGREAVDLFERNHYDLILMDIQMPVMDGYTATRMIRRIEERRCLPRTAVVALTAHAYEADIRKCTEAGCDDHLAKPFKKKALFTMLARYIRGIDYE